MTNHLTKPIRAIHFLVLAFLLTICTNVSAFDTAHLRKLKDTNECIACDLRGAELTNEELEALRNAMAVTLTAVSTLRFALGLCMRSMLVRTSGKVVQVLSLRGYS